MALTLNFANTGLGLSSYIGIYRWNGHSFNPSCDSDYQSWNPWTQAWDGVAIYGATSSFDLSGFRYGNEAILAAIKFTSSVVDSGTFYFYWYDPDNNLLFTFLGSWSCPGVDFWYAAWSGIGVKAGTAQEIWKNGTYHVTIK
jgi:hypothetical protein